ncbi:MAG: YceI family protein, partial [Acidimicrobiia bacterium]|nr:YceI family protein [Acidimicrobiia bacterium]
MTIKKLAIGVGIALAVLIAAVWWLFFWGDTPEAVDVEAANTQLDVDLAVTTDDAPATAPDPFDGDINATWVVDDEIGEFDFETASGSFAGFRVDEELTIGEVVAVGRTGGVSGTVTIEEGRLIGTDITVDMGSITSNDARREFPIRRAVMANEFPTATFVLTSPVDLPAGLATGEMVTVSSSSSSPRAKAPSTRLAAGLYPRLMAQPHVPTSLDQITAEVMTDALRSSGFDEVTVASVSAERIAIGEGFLGELARLTLDYSAGSGPATAIAKIPTTDSGLKPIGDLLDVYGREHRAYANLLPQMKVRTPQAYLNVGDDESLAYCLV